MKTVVSQNSLEAGGTAVPVATHLGRVAEVIREWRGTF
ncbi:protein of unknown function [Agreia sp. COWG]|nr:protein of unknown function [Agreia sp. COWG]